MNKVLLDIIAERERQDEKWGKQTHAPAVWMTILTEEVGEAAAEAMELTWLDESDKEFTLEELKAVTDRWREELIQCSAVCVAIVEEIDGVMK